MVHVIRKQVYRWYVNDNPYGTCYSAYKSVAHRILRIEVFGGDTYPLLDERIDEIDRTIQARSITEDTESIWPRTSVKNRAWDELMAVRFPHTKNTLCTLHCRMAYNELGENLGHEHKSCKGAINTWIHDKVLELQAEDEANAEKRNQ